MAITLRSVKLSALSHNELDTNFTDLDGRAHDTLIGETFGSVTASGNVAYCSFLGNSPGSISLEERHKTVCPAAGTINKFYFKSGVNTRTGDVVVTLLINGADSGISVTVTAGSTATFSDLVNTAAISAGGTLSLKVDATAAGTGSLTYNSWGISM